MVSDGAGVVSSGRVFQTRGPTTEKTLLAGTKLYCLVTAAHVGEQLAQSRYLVMQRPGVEPATSRSRVGLSDTKTTVHHQATHSTIGSKCLTASRVHSQTITMSVNRSAITFFRSRLIAEFLMLDARTRRRGFSRFTNH